MYSIELTEVGRHMFDERDKNLERAVLFLIEKIGPDAWRARKRAIIDRFNDKLSQKGNIPIEGISVRDREDEIGWYLHLGEQAIADPPSVDADQAARVIPYLSALGRKLDRLLTVANIADRVDGLVRLEAMRDPDQGIFELLVGAAYAEEGWQVTALPEQSGRKTPDFQIDRPGVRFLVECKRLTRRAEYTVRERDAWLRLWHPASEWLLAHRVSLVWSILLHDEIDSYAPDYLLSIVREYVESGRTDFTARDDKFCLVTVVPVDYSAISEVLSENYIKRNSSREREVITGRHEPDFGLTATIGGNGGTFGGEATSNEYWDKITYVHAAYWRCDSPIAVNSKARDVLKRLAEATRQLDDVVPGIVHIGIETAEGDDVELVRSGKIAKTLEDFDPRGKKLAWVFLHFFRGESPPDEMWAVDETTQYFGGPAFRAPLRRFFLLGDESVPDFPRAHWEKPRK